MRELTVASALLVAGSLWTGCAMSAEETSGDDEVVRLAGAAVPVDVGLETLYSEVARGPLPLYLNRHGGTYVAGPNDSSQNSSSVVASSGQESAVLPAFSGDGAAWSEIVGCVRRQFEPFDVRVTDSEPAVAPYIEVVLGGTGHEVGWGGFGGVAPIDKTTCRAIPGAVGFVFTENFQGDLRRICESTAHEAGHALSLEHALLCEDPMSYLSGCGAKAFRDIEAQCGESEAQACSCERTRQNSVAILNDKVGAASFDCPEVDRLAGADRFATAAAISGRLFAGGADVAVLASGSDVSPDALAAGPLARKLGAPLLLSHRDSLPQATAQELARLQVSELILAGGEAALSAGVAAELSARGYAVERIAGADRFATAAKIARRVGAPSELAYVASGAEANLVDALAAGGPAALLGAPILLVTRDAVPSETAAALADLNISKTIVAGGAAAVSDAVLAELPSPVRIAGSNRYATAAAIAADARGRGVPADHVWVARGDRMPDALAAGAAGRLLLLATPALLPPDSERFLREQGVERVTLLGGTAALGRDVAGGACYAIAP